MEERTFTDGVFVRKTDAQAEIARLTAEVEQLRASHADAIQQYARVLDERDTIAADAFEAAARLTEGTFFSHPSVKITRAIAMAMPELAKAIRALTTADATAAREARDRAKVAEGMRAAAAMPKVELVDSGPSGRHRTLAVHEINAAILARAAEVEAGK